VRRYERAAPGELVHVDIKKLGNIPDGGGWRAVGYAQGKYNARATTPVRHNCHAVIGYSYLHTAIDDHSRLAYSEILADERKETAAAFWHRACAWFTAAGITIERVMTDNGARHRSFAWSDELAATSGSAPTAPRPTESRAFQPHPARRVGLRPPLPLRRRTARRL
jgi:integrase-like protein